MPTYLALRGGGYDAVVREQGALMVWWLIAFGYAVGLFPRGRLSRAAIVPLAGIAAMVGLTALSVAWTESDGRTYEELTRVVGYAGVVVLALSSLNRFTWRAAAAGVSVAALAIAGLAVASRLAPGAFPVDEVARAFDTDRLNYPLNYWNGVGAWGAMSVAIGLAWSSHARLALTRSIALAAVPVAGLSVYLTYSRGGVIGAGVALAAVIVLSRNRWTAVIHAVVAAAGTGAAILVVRGEPAIAKATGGAGGGKVAVALGLAAAAGAAVAWISALAGTDRIRLPREAARIAAPALVVALLAGAATVGRPPISDAWDEFRNQKTVSVGTDPASRLTTAGGTRNDHWESALGAMRTDRWKGTGPGTFEFWWSRDNRDPQFVRDAHSIYFESLAELGYPGLVVLVVFLAGALGAALWVGRSLEHRSDVGARVALTAAFVVFLVQAGVDWMWELTAVGVLAVAGISIAVAAGSRRRPRLPLWARGAIVVAAALAGAIQIPGIVSTERLRGSQDALAAGDRNSALRFAEEAVDAEPWSADPYEQRSRIEEADGNLRAAATDIQDAIERESTNPQLWLSKVRIEGKRGRRHAAEAAVREVRRLDPDSPVLVNYYFRFVVPIRAEPGG